MEHAQGKVPGILLSLGLAIIATYLGSFFPTIGGPVFALFGGMLLSTLIRPAFEPGLEFTSKKLLRLAIILLGFGLEATQILAAGKVSLVVMLCTLSAAFGFGALLGRLLGLDWRLSSLISAGTGICGGSAIAALSPVIEAEDSQVAIAISATFIFDLIMIILFPIMGRALGLSDWAYGLWTGTAVNDTASVIAAGFAYSNRAGDYATIVKLTRTLSIIPTIIIFSFLTQRKKQKAATEKVAGDKKKVKLTQLFPYFIIFFLLAALVNSFSLITPSTSAIFVKLSKFFMVMALGAIGMGTELEQMKKAGFTPMLHGFIISAIVVLVSIGVQFLLGQV